MGNTQSADLLSQLQFFSSSRIFNFSCSSINSPFCDVSKPYFVSLLSEDITSVSSVQISFELYNPSDISVVIPEKLISLFISEIPPCYNACYSDVHYESLSHCHILNPKAKFKYTFRIKHWMSDINFPLSCMSQKLDNRIYFKYLPLLSNIILKDLKLIVSTNTDGVLDNDISQVFYCSIPTPIQFYCNIPKNILWSKFNMIHVKYGNEWQNHIEDDRCDVYNFVGEYDVELTLEKGKLTLSSPDFLPLYYI